MQETREIDCISIHIAEIQVPADLPVNLIFTEKSNELHEPQDVREI